MAPVAITLACGDYDRTRALADGRVQALLGRDYWSYGLTGANQLTLATFLRYAREQGLAAGGIEPADLFAPETLDILAV